MTVREEYEPGPAMTALVEKAPEKWTLILTRELRHAPEKVWQALTDPAHLREWAPFEADRSLDTVGDTVNLTWIGTGNTTEATVIEADAPRVLAFQNMRWELEPVGSGTRLTLWHSIPPRFIAWGAAGWQISFDVLEQLLGATPIGRFSAADSMKMPGWQRLVAEYAAQFGVEPPKRTPPAAQQS
jgi:uncharacterized protein YndB with AHSA1/START domain